ncbi:MAG: dipeptidase [Deltaproteobacteria bacterium]|nr:dipeptidase [Deltaproteobacteria bacterium]
MIPNAVLETINAHRQRYLDDLLDFLRIPSISTYSQNSPDIRNAAEWVLRQLKRLGFHASLRETERHPIIYGEMINDPSAPTLLVYGHYDVQPPEPLEEWTSPPFQPSLREGFVYARGATDDKGQFLTHLKAMEAIMEVEGKLPLNVKLLVEGEEEIASPSLKPYLEKHRLELGADAAVISDGSQFSSGIPAITYGLRGLTYFQVDVTGPRIDLHSGVFGGIVANPIQTVTQILARTKNEDGTIAIPGFYDDVIPLEEWERNEMASLPLDEESLKDYLGVGELTGEKGYSILERKTARPTLDINGIWGGFSGEGAKTVIPSRAGAKVSMRLVPNQKPAHIERLFRDFVMSLTPKDVKIQITTMHSAEPVLIGRDKPGILAAERAIEIGFGKRPVYLREGGSIPVVNWFKETLGIQTILLLGWGSPDDGAHSPNERFRLEDFQRGIRAAAALMYENLI